MQDEEQIQRGRVADRGRWLTPGIEMVKADARARQIELGTMVFVGGDGETDMGGSDNGATVGQFRLHSHRPVARDQKILGDEASGRGVRHFWKDTTNVGPWQSDPTGDLAMAIPKAEFSDWLSGIQRPAADFHPIVQGALADRFIDRGQKGCGLDGEGELLENLPADPGQFGLEACQMQPRRQAAFHRESAPGRSGLTRQQDGNIGPLQTGSHGQGGGGSDETDGRCLREARRHAPAGEENLAAGRTQRAGRLDLAVEYGGIHPNQIS